MKRFRVMKLVPEVWCLLERDRPRTDWRTVSRHRSRQEAKAAETVAFQREIERINATISVTHIGTTSYGSE